MGRADKPLGDQALATRERLLRYARAAFATKGYDATHIVSDVLEPSGVSTGSFYHQFRSKADLYAAVVRNAAAGWQSPFELVTVAVAGTGGPDTLVDAVRRAYANLFDLVDRSEDLVRIQHRDSNHPDPEVSEPLRALRESWVETLTTMYQGLTPDPEGAAELIVALAMGTVMRYLDTPKYRGPESRDHLIENLTTFTLGGFLALADPRSVIPDSPGTDR